MKKKSVLVNYLGRKGGAPVYAYEMTKGLINNGCDVYAIIPSTIDNRALWEELPLRKLSVIDTYSNALSFVIGVFRFLFVDSWKIKRQYKNISIDYCYVPMIQPWAELINRLFPKAKKIVTLHDPKPHSGSGRIMNYLYRRVVKQADEVVILSKSFCEYTSKEYGIEPSHIHVIPHGVFDYYGKFKPEKIERNSKINFLFFGRITPYKGLDILARAYNRLFDENKDISLYVVGSGDFTPYENLFNTDNNTTVVNKFIDDSDVVSYFHGDNIVTVLPYIDATQSGVIPIAMKEKSLLIVSNTGGLLEQTDGGKLAVICEPNEESLYLAMKKVSTSLGNYEDTVRKAKEYIEKLDWNYLASMLADIMELN